MGHTSRPSSLLATKASDAERDALVEEAWRLAKEAVERGSMTLKNGKVVELSAKDQILHVHWLASMGKKPLRSMPLPKDIFVAPTQ